MSAGASMMSAQMAPAAQVALWIAALIALVIGAFVVMSWLRGRWLEGGGRSVDADPMSLDQIRQLHREGAITDAERDALRAQTLLWAGSPASRTQPAHADHFREEVGEVRQAPAGFDLTGEPLPSAPRAQDGHAAQESEGT